jgi:hypothetical protein
MNLSPKPEPPPWGRRAEPETGWPAGPVPRQPEKAGVPKSQADIIQLLAPVRRAMGLERIARGAFLGLAAGSAVGAAVLVALHIHTFHFAVQAGLLAIAVGVMAGVAFAIWRWPGAPEAARAADFHFHLNDRLTTALELRSSDTPVALVQRREVTSRIDGLPLAQSRGPWLRRRDGAVTALAAMAFAGALALGSPGQVHHTAAAAPSESQRMRKAAATQLQQLTSKLHLGLTPAQLHSEALRKLDLALARLRRQLLQASTRRTALRAISTTQQQLRQLALGLHPVNAKAVAQLNSSLARYLNKGQAANNTQASARSMLATAQALNRLAQSLAHLTPAQRAALALALAKAANATSDNTLRQGLHQAASSLANGDAQSASAALQQTAQALAQTPSAQAALSRLGAAGSQLNLLKNQVSGVAGQIPAGTPNGSQSNQPGASNTGSSGRGTGRRNGYSLGTRGRSGKGRGTGNRTGSQGRLGIRGRGTGRGTRAGRGTGRGQNGQPQGNAPTRSGTSGARGRGGRGQGGLSRRGRNATVYIPARQGRGQETIQNGPSGAPAPGAIVPYHQVIGQFTQSARQALDRATLPSSLQQYVRRYFGTLSQ